MASSWADARALAESAAADAAKLEQALDQRIAKIGTWEPAPAASAPPALKFRRATVLLFWIGLILATVAAFVFGFAAAFR